MLTQGHKSQCMSDCRWCRCMLLITFTDKEKENTDQTCAGRQMVLILTSSNSHTAHVKFLFSATKTKHILLLFSNGVLQQMLSVIPFFYDNPVLHPQCKYLHSTDNIQIWKCVNTDASKKFSCPKFYTHYIVLPSNYISLGPLTYPVYTIL